MPQITVYLTNEEHGKIRQFMKKHHLKRHAAIKRAIRLMLGLNIRELTKTDGLSRDIGEKSHAKH